MITTKIEPIEETFGSRARVKIMKLLAINEELSISWSFLSGKDPVSCQG